MKLRHLTPLLAALTLPTLALADDTPTLPPGGPVNTVPEPGSAALSLAALAIGLRVARRRRQRRDDDAR